MISLFLIESMALSSKVIMLAIFLLVMSRILYYLFRCIEMVYVKRTKKPLFIHFYPFLRKLTKEQKRILDLQFKFYNRLSDTEKVFFEHRATKFISNRDFIGKQDLQVTDEMKILIAATLVKLTFGLRDYNIDVVDKIIIYPTDYYSAITKSYHKGEFNLGYKALVFSWEHFLRGYNIEDDNLNLAVHEFIHAMHFYYLKNRKQSTSATLFLDSYDELKKDLDNNTLLKNKMISMGYFRDYAFENQFEFIAVLVENFIETPLEFRLEFPEIYIKIKQMLNFNFANY